MSTDEHVESTCRKSDDVNAEMVDSAKSHTGPVSDNKGKSLEQPDVAGTCDSNGMATESDGSPADAPINVRERLLSFFIVNV